MCSDLEANLASVQSELDALRSEFNDYTYAVSHDLAAPFRQIEGFASIIQLKYGEQFDEKSRRHFDLIIKGAANGARMVESLLDYSRISLDSMNVHRVDCNTIVADVLSEHTELVADRNAKITTAQLPLIEADDKLMDKLFYHLIHNALLYHKCGSQPIVEIDCIEDKDWWKFSIRDNGIGIPSSKIDRVFMVFKRAVSDKDYPGVGMGLAFARRVVQLHRGNIRIKVKEGEGCSVYFTLPKHMSKA